MAYAATNPPVVYANTVGGNNLWLYISEDIHTSVAAANYFANGLALGMKVNDVVTVVKSTATIGATQHVVTEVSADGATVSAAILA